MKLRRPLLVCALLVAACSKEPPAPVAGKEPATTATAAAAPASAAETASAAPIAPAPPPMAVAPKAPSTPEPTLKEWEDAKADLSLVGNWDGPGCMPRRVREWIRIGCAASSTKSGAPVSIRVNKGFPKAKFSVLDERAGSTMLVFPSTEGLDAEATFTFAEGSFLFKASWPSGQPEPKKVGAFEAIEEPAEAPAAADDAPGGSPEQAAPPKPEKLVVSTDPLPELPVLEGAPTEEQWSAAKDVGVRGSDAHGCETKQSGDWLRVVCRSNNVTGAVTATNAIRGVDPKEGYFVTGNGAMVLLVKYVKGIDVAIDVTWEHTSGRLSLRWPDSVAGPPAMRGEIASR